MELYCLGLNPAIDKPRTLNLGVVLNVTVSQFSQM